MFDDAQELFAALLIHFCSEKSTSGLKSERAPVAYLLSSRSAVTLSLAILVQGTKDQENFEIQVSESFDDCM